MRMILGQLTRNLAFTLNGGAGWPRSRRLVGRDTLPVLKRLPGLVRVMQWKSNKTAQRTIPRIQRIPMQHHRAPKGEGIGASDGGPGEGERDREREGETERGKSSEGIGGEERLWAWEAHSRLLTLHRPGEPSPPRTPWDARPSPRNPAVKLHWRGSYGGRGRCRGLGRAAGTGTNLDQLRFGSIIHGR